MPARSNEFQRLVFLLQRMLNNEATVAESVLLRDEITGSAVKLTS